MLNTYMILRTLIALTVTFTPELLLAQSPVERTIKIGVVTDLSGDGAYWGTQSIKGVEFAVAQLRSQGASISLVIEDAALQSSKAISAVQKLITIDHVDALFVEFTPHIVPALPTINHAKVPTVYVAAAESPVEKSPYAFKLFQSYRTGCRDVARRFIAQGKTPLGVLTADAEYGTLCLEGIKEVTTNFINSTYTRGSSLATEVLSLKQKGAQSIINAGFEADTINTLQAMAKIDFIVPIGGGKEDLFTEKVLRDFTKNLSGSLGFALPELSTSFQDKLTSYLQQSHSALTQPQAVGEAYAGVNFLYAALSACKFKDVQCSVEKLKDSPPMPDIGFDGFDDRRVGIFKQRIVVVP